MLNGDVVARRVIRDPLSTRFGCVRLMDVASFGLIEGEIKVNDALEGSKETALALQSMLSR